jgi:hypothetical protein
MMLCSLDEPKRSCQEQSKQQLFSIDYMSDATRRAALRRYLADKLKGDRATLMRKSGLSKGRITQLFDDEEPFGERAARALAVKCGLEPEYFNHVESDSAAMQLDPDQIELLRLWEPLFEDQKLELMESLRLAHKHALRAAEEIVKRGLVNTAKPERVAANFKPAPKVDPMQQKKRKSEPR